MLKDFILLSVDSLESLIYQEKVAQLDTLIRQCLFNVKGLMDASVQENMISSMIDEHKDKKGIEESISKAKTTAKLD